jgi:hypothetical protein
MKKPFVGLLAVVLGCLIASSLSACDNNLARGPLALKRDGSHLLIAVCTDIRPVTIYGDFKNESQGRGLKEYLDGKGTIDFHRGDVVSTAEDWPGMAFSVRRDPDMTAGASISVSFTPVDRMGQFTATFGVHDRTLSSTRWLHPDGTTTKAPCTGVRPIPAPSRSSAANE